MSIGQTAENIPILILLALAYIPTLFLLIALGALIRSLLRIQSAYFGLGFIVLLLFGPLIGASLYLDTVGKVVPAQVVKREESIDYREQGDWQHKFSFVIQYDDDNQSSEDYQSNEANQLEVTAHFGADAATFDRLHEGEIISVRTVNVGRWLNLVRLANQTTLTWLPWEWISIGLGVILLGIGLWRLSKVRFGYGVIVIVLLALAVWPLLTQLGKGQRSEDLSLTPLRATGTIQVVERVTEIDPLPSYGSADSNSWETRINALQPYDIVSVRFTPQGYKQSVLGVDAVDANSVVVQLDAPVEVAYALTEPRTVRLLSGTRSHYWKNPFEWVKQQILSLLLIALLILAFSWLGNKARKWWQVRMEQRGIRS